jgi:hypothetical protein
VHGVADEVDVKGDIRVYPSDPRRLIPSEAVFQAEQGTLRGVH